MTTAIRKRLPRNDGLHKDTGTAKYAGGAPVIHELNDDIYDAARNLSRRTHPSFGDLQKGFAGADHVFEHTFETQLVNLAVIENAHRYEGSNLLDLKVLVPTQREKGELSSGWPPRGAIQGLGRPAELVGSRTIQPAGVRPPHSEAKPMTVDPMA